MIRWLVLIENIVYVENSQLDQNQKKQGILPLHSELEKLTNLYGQNMHGSDVMNTEGENYHTTNQGICWSLAGIPINMNSQILVMIVW